MLVEVPAKFLTPTSNAWHYFLIGTSFNALRILALGIDWVSLRSVQGRRMKERKVFLISVR
ncbi:MAG: hypothetical protein R2867_39515 [Caldilineaceae bacterium]